MNKYFMALEYHEHDSMMTIFYKGRIIYIYIFSTINVTLLSALRICKIVNTILIYKQCNYKERNHV